VERRPPNLAWTCPCKPSPVPRLDFEQKLRGERGITGKAWLVERHAGVAATLAAENVEQELRGSVEDARGLDEARSRVDIADEAHDRAHRVEVAQHRPRQREQVDRDETS
jgi:hypothetical protein